MIKNYFKTAWRNLIRSKVFSTINISGLALGLTCSLLIMLWVQDEYSVDAFHKNNPQLYHVYERRFDNGKVEAGYKTRGLLADELKANIPGIEYASAIETSTSIVCEAGDKILKMDGVFAGSDFFTMFSYPLLQGTPKTVLNGTVSIVISRRMAEEFFGSAGNAIGKVIRYGNKEDLAVTGVFENLPANSSQQFDFVRTWEAFVNQQSYSYIKILIPLKWKQTLKIFCTGTFPVHRNHVLNWACNPIKKNTCMKRLRMDCLMEAVLNTSGCLA